MQGLFQDSSNDQSTAAGTRSQEEEARGGRAARAARCPAAQLPAAFVDVFVSKGQLKYAIGTWRALIWQDSSTQTSTCKCNADGHVPVASTSKAKLPPYSSSFDQLWRAEGAKRANQSTLEQELTLRSIDLPPNTQPSSSTSSDGDIPKFPTGIQIALKQAGMALDGSERAEDRLSPETSPMPGFSFPVKGLPLDAQWALLQQAPQEHRPSARQSGQATIALKRRSKNLWAILQSALAHHAISGAEPLNEAQQSYIAETISKLVYMSREASILLVKVVSAPPEPNLAFVVHYKRLVRQTAVACLWQEAFLRGNLLATDISAHEQSAHHTLSTAEAYHLSLHIKANANTLVECSFVPPATRNHLWTILLDLLERLPRDKTTTGNLALKILSLIARFAPAGEHIMTEHSPRSENYARPFLRALGVVISHVVLCHEARTLDELQDRVSQLEPNIMEAWSHGVHAGLMHKWHGQLATLQQTALRVGLYGVAARILLDCSSGPISGVAAGKKIGRQAFPVWRETVTCCLRAGRTELGEELLARMPVNDASSAEVSTYWHQRLQTVVRSPPTNSSTSDPKSLHRLSDLLKEIEDSPYRPDRHFLVTLLRSIPAYVNALDEACDIFNSAVTLCEMSDQQPEGQSDGGSAKLAAMDGELRLFERARKEGQQLPWPAPVVSAANFSSTQASAPGSVSRSAVLAIFIEDSLYIRSLILQNRYRKALQPYEHMLSYFRSQLDHRSMVEQVRLQSPGKNPLKTLHHIVLASSVRMLSAALSARDLPTATRVVEMTQTRLGHRYVGQRAIRRLLMAMCSSVFRKNGDRGLRSGSNQPSKKSLHAVIHVCQIWADQEEASRNNRESAYGQRSHMSRRRSGVLQGPRACELLARAAGEAVCTEFYLRKDGSQQSEQARHAFMSVIKLMQTLQTRTNYVKWWKYVEDEVSPRLKRRADGCSRRWEQDRERLAEVCKDLQQAKREMHQVRQMAIMERRNAGTEQQDGSQAMSEA